MAKKIAARKPPKKRAAAVRRHRVAPRKKPVPHDPLTAKINRHQTRLAPPVIDGDPKLQPIEGTSLSYVVNSPVPIVVLNPPTDYYAVQDGVWFVGASVRGPSAVSIRP